MEMEGYGKSIDPKYGDFVTPEQSIPDTGMPGVDWETCMTMNTTWGYSAHDHAWKSNETLVRNLVDIASKGGNYLLNIGPTGDGSVPKESTAGMQAIGAWLKVNGASIYGTAASRFSHLPWGRSTTKGSTVYLQVFDWPKDGKLLVPGLRNTIKGARLLAGGAITSTPHAQGVVLTLPASAPDPIATVVELELDGEPIVRGAN
jgi:alpha-L-fucosidase